jgi:hypothetical protein
MDTRDEHDGSESRIKKMLLTSGTTIVFFLGVYSLFLASASAGKVQPLAEHGLLRTAVADDHERIALTLGPTSGSDVVYVAIDAPLDPPDPGIEQATRQAAQTLVDSGVLASTYRLRPSDPSFAAVVKENEILRFPAVLVVKKDGGIVLVTEDHSAESLVRAFQAVWGKRSDCGAASDEIY